MSDRVFLDTNVLVYVYDTAEPEKQRLAEECVSRTILEGRAVVSTQVLQEFYVNVTRKLDPPLEADAAYTAVEGLGRLQTVLARPELILAGIRRCKSDRMSFWDALIVEAALEARCALLLSEDLQDGRTYADLRVENPFRILATT